MSAQETTPRKSRPPGGDDESHLLGIVAGLVTELGHQRLAVALDDDLERNLGLGSLERADLVTRVEGAFTVTLPDRALVDTRTPRDLLIAVDAARNGHEVPAGRLAPPVPRETVDDAAAEGEWHVPGVGEIDSLVDLARYRAEVGGERAHLRFLGDADDDVETLSYADLWSRALRFAAGASKLGVRHGDRIALVLPTSADFFVALLGAQCAGCVPVPIYPPIRKDELAGYLERQSLVLADAGAVLVVADEELSLVAEMLRDRTATVREAATVTAVAAGRSYGGMRVGADDLGLIQYTSGSTSLPKGVALRHHHLLANMRAIGQGLQLRPGDLVASWAPLYHDMGLIGCWMTAMLHAVPGVLLSPLQFLRRPERWLWTIHRYRATLAPSPNFGYELICRKVRDEAIEGLDLSSWRLAINGAEAVQQETVERFCRRFEPYGFRRSAMFPVYGLAETCLGLTVPPAGREPRFDVVDRELLRGEGRAVPRENGGENGDAGTAFACVGSPLATQEVRVVPADDPEGEELAERHEGRIQMRGPSVMEGYFHQPEASRAVRFGDWTDTGDLGYFADGELYVTGRSKDLIIKGGRNYHPQDIEQAAASVDGIRRGCVIAFGVPSKTTGEAIVVVAETRVTEPGHAKLSQRVSDAVRDAVAVPADRIVLVPPGTVPKTSSGKLRRREGRTRYLAGTLKPPARGRRVLLAVALRAGRARARSWLRWLNPRLHLLFRGAPGAVIFFLTLLAVATLCRTRQGAWKLGRRGVSLALRTAGIRVRRLGPPLGDDTRLLVSNHGNYLDQFFLMLALERPMTVTAKASFFSSWIFGRALRLLGAIPVDRDSTAGYLTSFEKIREAMAGGERVHLFPEGTFTFAAGIRPLRLGAFKLAVEEGLAIQPVVLRGARAVMGGNDRKRGTGTVTVEALEPIVPSGVEDLREVIRLRDATRQAFAAAVGEPIRDVTSAAPETGNEFSDR